MPNVLFTQTCVRSCPYCFARKHMSASSPEDILGWEDLIYLADFFELSEVKRFSVLGGEPSLHPAFNDYLVYLIERGFDVTVFTCGIMPDEVLDECVRLFRNLPPPRFSFVCNLNDPEKTHSSLAEQASVKRFLRAFGEQVVPGFNIYRPDFKLEFLFQAINEFGLQRNIRLGVAHPIPGTRNLHIPVPEIESIVARLFSYAPLFERFRVRPGLDCGFPLCKISDEQLGWLARQTSGHLEFGCGPVIDIGPDLSVWGCFPLSDYDKKSVYEFNHLKDIEEHFRKLHDSVHTEVGGIYMECDDCRFREELFCAGGCIAHALQTFREEEPVRLKEVYP